MGVVGPFILAAPHRILARAQAVPDDLLNDPSDLVARARARPKCALTLASAALPRAAVH